MGSKGSNPIIYLSIVVRNHWGTSTVENISIFSEIPRKKLKLKLKVSLK